MQTIQYPALFVTYREGFIMNSGKKPKRCWWKLIIYSTANIFTSSISLSEKFNLLSFTEWLK